MPEPLTPGRRLLRGALAVAGATALFLITACGGGGASSTGGTTGGTFTVSTSAGTSLDPANANPPSFVLPAYDPLIYQQTNGDLVADLATDWKYLDDTNTKFQLTIRDGVTFSDGDALTADAVVTSLQRFLSLTDNPNLAYAGPVQSVEATDANTVLITYSEAFPAAAVSLTQDYRFGLIVSPTGVADPDALATETHGAGQYVLDPTQTVTGSTYTYVKNDDYWNPSAVTFDKVVRNVVSDESARLASVESGQSNLAEAVSQLTAQEGAADGLQPANTAGSTKQLLLVNRDDPSAPLHDVRVRQAISLALDRQSIADAVLTGGTPSSSIAQEGALGYTGTAATQQDLSQAKQLLADAGYPDGVTLKLLDVDTIDPDYALGTAVIDQLKQAGITVELVQATGSFDNFLTPLYAMDADMAVWAWSDINTYFQFATNLIPSPSIANPAGGSDATLNQLMATAATASDLDSAMKDVVSYYDSLYWSVSIAYVPQANLFSADVTNLWSGTSAQVAVAFSPDPAEALEFSK